MKTIANCTPEEFMVQTNKIRKRVAAWLKDTNILEIRKRMPKIDDSMRVTDSMTEEEKAEAIAKAKELGREQAKRNIEDMLDSALEKHPRETAELLGLLCFVDPQDLNKHKMIEFWGAILEIISDQEVIDFFISLTHLVQNGTLTL